MPTIKVSRSGDGGTLYFPTVLSLQACCISKMRLKTRETDAMRRASKTLFPTIVLAVEHRAGGRELEIVVIVCCFQGVESDAESYKHLVIACKEAIRKFECPVEKALDIMCSVGRFSYELSKHFDEVT